MSPGLRRRVVASRGLLAGLLALAMLAVVPLVPAPASAGVRSPSGASPFALQRMAEAPSARGRWDPCTVIGYRVNRALAGPGAVRDVREAVRRLSAATGLTFAYRGRTTLVPQADWGPRRLPGRHPGDRRLGPPVPDHVVAGGRVLGRRPGRRRGDRWRLARARDRQLGPAVGPLHPGIRAAQRRGDAPGRLRGRRPVRAPRPGDHARAGAPGRAGPPAAGGPGPGHVPRADPPPWPLGERGPDRPAPGRRHRRVPARPRRRGWRRNGCVISAVSGS